MPLDLPALMDDVVRGRQQLLLGLAATTVLAVGTLLGAVVGPVVASATVDGSVVPEGLVSAGVAVASLAVSAPLSLFMLGGSVVWHRRVRAALVRVGVEGPAVGILAPARLVAVPLALGLGLTAVLLPVPFVLPVPDAANIVGNALYAVTWVLPAIGPVVGLVIGWRRGIDRSATAAHRAGTLDLGALSETEIAAFPLVDRAPRTVRAAELLRRAGRLGEADALLRAYLEQVGVAPLTALVTWARIHDDAGRVAAAERCLAEAARLVPIDLRALRALAGLRRARGLDDDARAIEDVIAAIRYGNLGFALGRSQRVQA